MIRIFLALSSALLLILSFPNFDLGFLAWVGLVPFFLAIRGKSLGKVLGLSYLMGVGFFLGVFFWINSIKSVTLLHYSILGLYLGLYLVVFGYFFYFISSKFRFPSLIPALPLWVAVEYLRSHAGFAALPMGHLGFTQHQNLPLLQIASFTGVYGVSFVIVMVNVVITDLIGYWIGQRGEKRSVMPNLFRHLTESKQNETLNQPMKRVQGMVQGDKQGLSGRWTRYNPVYGALASFIIILVLWVAGNSLSPTPSGKSISVAVVQGNIPQEMKWKREYREQIFSKYEALSEEASRFHPQIIVWPEASTPGFILKDITLYQRMVYMVRRFNTYILAGSAEYPKFGKRPIKLKSGNTALFFSPEGKVIGQYLKIRLAPFGEYVPYEGVFPWPEFLVSKETNSNLAGTEPILFEVDGTKFGTLICSEILYPELGRCMVEKGAGFLVNINNEAWFGKSAYSYQALSIAIFRAVENRVNLVRSNNTGVSGFIDPYGRVTARLTHGGEDLFVEGTLTHEIFLSPAGTFYTRYGDVFVYGCIAFSIGLMIWSFSRKSQRIKTEK